eukprot:augustus_masked-scaffold_12-processed-gene-7.2-mRNA-1 protein AED:0.34 eAED:0.35 QI:0/-1/0/1/-1/1/1/0/538
MPKNQYGQNKLFMTSKDIKGISESKLEKNSYERLPFYCCSLTFQPFTTPVTTKDGFVYELQHLLPYLKKFKKEPSTGNSLSFENLIYLTYHKNSEQKFHDPVTFKPFTNKSHIVCCAVNGQKKTANVYHYDTVKRLNIDKNSFRDLLSGKEFSKDDIIELQGPNRKNVTEYKDLKLEKAVPILGNKKIKLDFSSRKILQKADEAAQENERKAQLIFQPRDLAVLNNKELLDLKVSNQKRWKQLRELNKSGFCNMKTSIGDIKIELFFAKAPMACENFLTLASEGYFNKTRLESFFTSNYSTLFKGKGFNCDYLHFKHPEDDYHSIYRNRQNPEGFFKEEINSFPEETFMDVENGKEENETNKNIIRGMIGYCSGADENIQTNVKNKNASKFFLVLNNDAAHETYFETKRLIERYRTVFARVVDGFFTLEVMEGENLSEIEIESITVLFNPLKELRDKQEQGKKDAKKAQQESLSKRKEASDRRKDEKKREKMKKRAQEKGLNIGIYFKKSKSSREKVNPSNSSKKKTPVQPQWTFDSW